MVVGQKPAFDILDDAALIRAVSALIKVPGFLSLPILELVPRYLKKMCSDGAAKKQRGATKCDNKEEMAAKIRDFKNLVIRS